MPIYEYRCNECQQVFENWQRDFEEHDVPCPVCQGHSVRVMSHTSFVLKGSGWYVTEYGGRPVPEKTEEKKDTSKKSVTTAESTSSSAQPSAEVA